jgi:hypothetical protein
MLVTDRKIGQISLMQTKAKLDWKAEKLAGPKARIVFSSLKVTLPLSAISEGI